MSLNKTISCLVLLLLGISSFAQNQQARLIVKNSEEGIRLKWFVEGFFLEEGVYVERKEADGQWTRLSTSPIKRQEALLEAGTETEMEFLNFLKSGIEDSPEKMKSGMVSLMIGQAVSLYDNFATYLGLQYIDRSAEVGKIYSYRILLESGSSEFAVSESIERRAQNELVKGLSEIVVEQQSTKLLIGWKPEPLIHFGANVYRRSPSDVNWKKVTERPVFPTESPNKKGKLEYPRYHYQDTSARIGNAYTYQLRPIDYFGEEGELSKELNTLFRDPIPPPRVQEWTIDRSGSYGAFSNWNAVDAEDLKGYRFYARKYPDTTMTLVLEVGNVLEANLKFPSFGEFEVMIASVDTGGNMSLSSPKILNLTDDQAPAKPTGLRIEAEKGKINLKWDANPESDLMGYYVYRTISGKEEKTYNLLNASAISQNKYTDVLPANAKNAFFYKVMAVDSNFNKSDYSEFAVGQLPDLTPPGQPTILKVFQKEENVHIQWQGVFLDDLEGFEVYRQAKETDPILITGEVLEASMTSYVDRGIYADGEYSYSLIAMDTAGNRSEASAAVTVAITGNQAAEEARISSFKLKYNRAEKVCDLRWKLVNDVDLLGWVLYRKLDEGPFVPVTGRTKAYGFRDPDLQKGVLHAYQLRLYSDDGKVILSSLIEHQEKDE